MKFNPLTLAALFCTSCTYTDHNTLATDNSTVGQTKPITVENTGSADLGKLNEAIARAVQRQDYRLLVTSGRGLSIPGIKASDYNAMIALCGKKYNAATGDVITSEEQRTARKNQLRYMRQYNKQMVIICQNTLNPKP